MPMVWIRVAIPAKVIAIWIMNTLSAPASPATPAMMIAGVTLEANMASTC